MKRSIAERLLELNRRFYEGWGGEFASSRGRLHPGMERTFLELRPSGGLLDLGCGHGRLARAWKEGKIPGKITHYAGIEFSRALLGLAPAEEENLRFLQADLARPGWSGEIRRLGFPVETVVCFSVLHHLPGRENRLGLLEETRSLLPPGGALALSVWQFLHVPELAAKVLPWSEAGLEEGDLEPGDLLFPWGRGGKALRYVHHFDKGELEKLLREAGFRVGRVFRSDGRTGDLGLYVLARKE